MVGGEECLQRLYEEMECDFVFETPQQLTLLQPLVHAGKHNGVK